MNTLISFLTFICVVISLNSTAQSISTFAGNGFSGYSGDGIPATSAKINLPGSGAFDKLGNYYFVERLGNRIRKVSVDGIISTFAGTGVSGSAGDGHAATTALLDGPCSIAFDASGDLFIADLNNNKIRKINTTTGIITTIAGTGVSGFDGDGYPASSATFSSVTNICFDKYGNLYICDNHRIRKISTDGIINTIAGQASPGFSSDGGLADTTKLNSPSGITCDTVGNLFIADAGNYRIRKIDNATGIISTVVGDGVGIYNGEGVTALTAGIHPYAITFNDVGNLFIGDYANDRVRKIDHLGNIQTIAGNGTLGYSGDDGPATSSTIKRPEGLCFDNCSNLYIADCQNNRIRKVTFNPACFPTEVQELPVSKGIFIYPNPAQTEISITSTKITLISLTNVLGKVIFSQEYNGVQKAEIDFSHLAPGVYIVKVNEQYVQKLVKE